MTVSGDDYIVVDVEVDYTQAEINLDLGTPGPVGASAYLLAVSHGYVGTEAEWISSLKGLTGDTGKSAYEVAVEDGFTGTVSEWIESLRGFTGADGKTAYEVAVDGGFSGTVDDWLASLQGIQGVDGRSAYEVAVDGGFVGSEASWISSLKGVKGDDGVDGKSAYQIAVEEGFSGSESVWLDSLRGATGAPGRDGATGAPGRDGVDGEDGKSAYEVAVTDGFVGTESQWLSSLHGADGKDGAPGKDGAAGSDGADGRDGAPGKDGAAGSDGADGKSSFEIAVDNGFVGTEVQWLESLRGEDGAPGADGKDGKEGTPGAPGKDGTNGTPGAAGQDGKTAYQVAVANGFVGSEAQWLASLKGATGSAGVGVPTGGSTGQVLSKASGTDYDTRWVTPSSGGGGTGADLPPVGAEGDVLTTVDGSWQAAPPQGGTPSGEEFELIPAWSGESSVLLESATVATPPALESQRGDVLVMSVMHRSALTHPEGWTSLGVAGPAPGNTFSQQMSLFWKKTLVNEIVSVTLTQETANRFAAAITKFTGCKEVIPRPDLTMVLPAGTSAPAYREMASKATSRGVVRAVASSLWSTEKENLSPWIVTPWQQSVAWSGVTETNKPRLGQFYDPYKPVPITLTKASLVPEETAFDDLIMLACELIGDTATGISLDQVVSGLVQDENSHTRSAIGDLLAGPREEILVPEAGVVTMAKSVRLVGVKADDVCRVRLYRSEVQKNADQDRAFTTMPTGDACLSDFKFSSAGEVWGNPQPVFSSSTSEYFVNVDGTANVTLIWEGA